MIYPDYPFNSHYASVNDLQLHYLDEGSKSAAPVVMLHGNPSWSFYYRKLVSALCKHYRCIVPDHIGMGFSDKPSASEYEFTLDQRVYNVRRPRNDVAVRLENAFPIRLKSVYQKRNP